MADSLIHRRGMLKGIGALSVGGALAALDGPARAVQVAPTPASDHTIEGVWLGPVTFAGSPSFQALFTFIKGGAITNKDLGGKVVVVLPFTTHGARVRLDGND